MKTRLLLLVAALLFASLVPVAIAFTQDTGPAAQFEITSVNPTALPLVRITASVRDPFGQPITGLTAADFSLIGELVGRGEIVSVTSVVDAALPISYVLIIDTSTSMDGMPIEKAKEAARAFVETLGPSDPVALMTFASTVTLVQDFTTDRAVILDALDALTVGGQTSLYEGGLVAVQKAAEADERRLVVLLSDGAQYDTRNPEPTAPRQAAAEMAARLGVPVYTIGLGFGTDRTYLQSLADSTNARFVESPTPEELRAAFDSLAQSFRSQYEILTRVNVPADGTTYSLGLQASTPFGLITDDAILRAPVPIPVLRAPVLLDEPISQPVEIPVEVLADDGIASVEVLVDGVSVGTLPAAPYGYTVDPVALLPGAHSLTFVATDNDGDTGSITIDFEVAVLPPEVAFAADLPSGDLREITVVEVTVSGQTAPASVTFRLDDQNGVPVAEAPFIYGLDPFTLTPGPHTLTITAENLAGAQTTITREFTVADLPPTLAVSGLEPNQTLEDSVTIGVDVLASQAPVTDIAFAVNGQPVGDGSAALTLRAEDLPPGPATLQVTVTNAIGQTSTANVPFVVAALPPTVTIDGLAPGEEIAEDRQITVTVGGQTPITVVTVTLDGAPFAASDDVYPLQVLALEPGPHTFSVDVRNAGGQRATFEIPFTVSAGPSLTATAMVTPTDTPTSTPSPTSTATATPTPDLAATAAQATANAAAAAAAIQATTDAAAAAAAAAQATADAFSAAATSTADTVAALAAVNASATADAASAAERATLDAQSAATAAAQATADSVAQQATLDAQATLSVEQVAATAAAQATAEAQATQDARTRADMQATVNAQATADLRATVNAQLTQSAQATQDTQATANAQQTAAAAAVTSTPTQDTQATQNAQATSTAAAQATLNAQAAAAQQATLDAQQATQAAQATLDAQQTTQAAQATLDAQQATQAAQATLDAQATIDVQAALAERATADARSTTSAAQATVNAQSTLDARATLDAQATERARATEDAQATQAARATEDAQATERARATEDAQATQAARATANAQATIDAQAAARPTEEATEEATAPSPSLTPTSQPTEVAQAVEDASATPTLTGADRTPVPTVTPIGTLIPAQAEITPDTTSGLLPVLLIGLGLLVLLIIIFLVLSRARRQR